jgi:hypothetical protein
MKNKETLEDFCIKFIERHFEDEKTYNKSSFITAMKASAKWQQLNTPIHILDVDNIKVSIQEGVVIVEKNDKTLRSYGDEEVENILIEYVKTNPTKPYRVVKWFNELKKIR